jgi:hypothetical protein
MKTIVKTMATNTAKNTKKVGYSAKNGDNMLPHQPFDHALETDGMRRLHQRRVAGLQTRSGNLERLLGADGMIYKPTDAERDDLTRLYMGMAEGVSTVDDLDAGEL